jgi:hypothetical protein
MMAEENGTVEELATNDAVAEMHESVNDARLASLRGALDGEGPGPAQDVASDSTTQPGTALSSANSDPDGLRIGQDLQSILKNLPQEQHDSVRAIFADNTRMRQQVGDFDKRLENAVGDAVNEAMTADAPDPIGGVSDEQLVQFEAIAKRLGFVKESDLQKERSDVFVQDHNKLAVDSFGDDFGTFTSDGAFVLNEAQAPALASHYQRLHDPDRGVSYRDLYIIENFDKLMDSAREQGRQDKGIVRTQLSRAQVEGMPTTARTTIALRGEENTKADSSQNVMARAMAAAKARLNGS